MKNGVRQRLLPQKRDAFTAIKRYFVDGDVKLREEEENILNRWILCDALLKAKEHNEEGIIGEVVKKFKVSVFTARNDIYHAQRLFADCRKLIKKYLIHLHLERIDEDLQRLRKTFFDKDGKCTADAKEMMALVKLHEIYTYTLNSIPDDIVKDKQPPPIFNFILAPGQMIDKPMELSEALKQADEIILTKNENGIYSSKEE